LSAMDPTQIRDRCLPTAGPARRLLGHFRAVEETFRHLYPSLRSRRAAWDGSQRPPQQGACGASAARRDSDPARSFQASWGFLRSASRQEEFAALLDAVLSLPAVAELRPDRRLLKIHFGWLQAGEQAQRTVARLSAELRRYLDDQAALENRRIMHL